MSGGGIVSTLAAGITWPASRFQDARRTYDLSIGPADVGPLIRGGVAVDPLFRPVSEGFAQGVRPEIVGRVAGDRFDIYISSKFSSGIGLVGTIEGAPGGGARVIANVGWSGPTKWVMPAVTVLALAGAAAFVRDVPAAMNGASDAWPGVALAAMVIAVQTASLISRERRARNDDLPMLFERLEHVLAPCVRT